MHMHIEWLLNPLTVYGIAAAGLSLSLALFIGIKWEMAKARALARESQGDREAEQTVVRGLQTEVETLRETVRKLEAAPPVRRIGTGINLVKRAQVLRMYHRGETISSIAAAMETPANEIELLLKVQAITSEPQSKAS
jgi:hypothetical protein